ncbi:uncharacterized protein LOC131680532 [Topomyia yanbarensis]|uniref:uncharacterized protein LOC131680532 n=1 Tax=Topomyia yanbarensis TaxID=2498891 RepID=UPI00273BC60D|nr:uncharacterized protein LOC131680532 [Topomyia yanbarensis]
MCSGGTLKFLCNFYACCNIFWAISIAVNADKVSEKIMRDNCSVNLIPDGSRVSWGICNTKTYGTLVFMLALGCIMSLLMVVGVALDKGLLLKVFRIFLFANITFLFGCWLAILISFYEAHSPMLMVLWGFVLVLCVVYFGMQIWIVSKACEAISKKSYCMEKAVKRESINRFIMDQSQKFQSF